MLDPLSPEDLKGKFETMSLRQVQERLAKLDEQIAEYNAYEQRFIEKNVFGFKQNLEI